MVGHFTTENLVDRTDVTIQRFVGPLLSRMAKAGNLPRNHSDTTQHRKNFGNITIRFGVAKPCQKLYLWRASLHFLTSVKSRRYFLPDKNSSRLVFRLLHRLTFMWSRREIELNCSSSIRHVYHFVD